MKTETYDDINELFRTAKPTPDVKEPELTDEAKELWLYYHHEEKWQQHLEELEREMYG